MNQQTQQQIVFVITQRDKQKKYVPFLQELDTHPLYWDFFTELEQSDRDDIQDMLRSYIVWAMQWLKTKWGEMFQRFYELHTELFWEFRALNWSEDNIGTDAFNEAWKKVEDALYHFEQILTKNMMKKPQGLEKVTDAFYSIAVRFFPHYYRVE